MLSFASKRTLYACMGLAIGGLILLGPMACDDHSGPVASLSAGIDDSASAALDTRLVGRWRHTDTYVSGSFTAAIDLWFILKADGTYEYSKGSVAAGDSDTSLVNGGHGDVARGKWRAESKILYTCAEGSSEWRPVGRYLVDDGRFMLGKVMWERQ